MATRTPAPDPTNRLPWITLGLVVLLIVIGVGAYLLNRPREGGVSIEGTPTANAVAKASATTAGAPPTLAVPTLPPSQPTTTPPPTVSPVPVATKPPGATPTQAAQAATAVPPTAPAANPTPAQPTPAPNAPAPPSPAPTPFAGQVANAGGLGNTRADFDAAYGPPTGETPQKLVAYRKENVEYHVGFVPDPNGRAALIVEIPPTTAAPMTLEAAMAEARKLLPKDTQPPTPPPPEGNDQFVVQRFTSQSLLQALGQQVFDDAQAPPGQFLVVYARDAAQGGRTTRFVMGVGNDPAALLDRGR